MWASGAPGRSGPWWVGGAVTTVWELLMQLLRMMCRMLLLLLVMPVVAVALLEPNPPLLFRLIVHALVFGFTPVP